jgi:hypothetical protein
MYLKNRIRARKIADLKPICTGFPSYVYEVMVLVIQLSRGRGRISGAPNSGGQYKRRRRRYHDM